MAQEPLWYYLEGQDVRGPVATAQLQRPDQNLNMQQDAQSYFLSQINKIYNANGVGAKGSYQGRYGFSYE